MVTKDEFKKEINRLENKIDNLDRRVPKLESFHTKDLS